jgi:hypothetical protein
VLRTRDVYPGSRIRIFSIREPGFSIKKIPGFLIRIRISIKESKIFIPDLDLDFVPNPDPGIKKAPDPGSATATLRMLGKGTRVPLYKRDLNKSMKRELKN